MGNRNILQWLLCRFRATLLWQSIRLLTSHGQTPLCIFCQLNYASSMLTTRTSLIYDTKADGIVHLFGVSCIFLSIHKSFLTRFCQLSKSWQDHCDLPRYALLSVNTQLPDHHVTSTREILEQIFNTIQPPSDLPRSISEILLTLGWYRLYLKGSRCEGATAPVAWEWCPWDSACTLR